MKIDRASVLRKYGHRCAYCGCDLTLKTMQVDHIHPQYLNHHRPNCDPNAFDNLNPSCRACNNFKHALSVEQMRKELSKQVQRLERVSQYQRAIRYGLLQPTGAPVVFWFEKYTTEYQCWIKQ